MDKAKIVELINKKLAEHQVELDGCQLDKDKVHKMLAAAKEDLKNNRNDAIIKAQSLMGLSVKSNFHKAALDVLNDLLKDINA